MQRTLAAVALALLATAGPAAAQVVVVQSQAVVPAPVVTHYHAPPVVAPSVSYYAAPAAVTTYAAPAPVVTHSYYAAPAAVTTYAAPAAVAVPATGVTTRTYRGYGVFRPRGVYTESYVRP